MFLEVTDSSRQIPLKDNNLFDSIFHSYSYSVTMITYLRKLCDKTKKAMDPLISHAMQ